MNDGEREMWLENDESLYNWRRKSRLPTREFIRQNRELIDETIHERLNK